MPYDHEYGYDDRSGYAHGPTRPVRRGPGGPGGGRGGGIPDGLLVSALGMLLGATVLTWTAAGFASVLSRGSWPEGVTFTRTPMAMRELAADPRDLAAAWPEAGASQLPGPGLFWGLFIGQLLVLTVLTVFAVGTVTRARAVRAARRSRPAVERDVQPQPPTETPAPVPNPAPAPAFEKVHEPAPALDPAPDIEVPTPDAGTPTAPTPYARAQDAAGALLVATSDPELWASTKDFRAKLGPVHLFDPSQLCDTPDRLRWSPHHGCADRATAASRATALLAPLRSPRPIDAEMHTSAETLLRCWLHAAALDDRPFREVHRWAIAKTAPTDPVQTLRTHPKAAPGSAGELESTLTGHPERRRQATELVRRALAPLSQLHVRNACTAARADRVALESFIDETGTLYVVGADAELMPILNALTQSVVDHGRRVSARTSPGLDPPLTTVLELPL